VRINDAERNVRALVEEQEEEGEADELRDVEDGRTPAQSGRLDDGGSDDELDDTPDDEDDEDDIESLEEKFRQLEEEVATLVADVHDLALYTKLNLTGFMKIVKKHDVSGLSVCVSHGIDSIGTPRRNKPGSLSRVHSFKTTWISDLSISTTGTQSSCVCLLCQSYSPII
jgi:hypothetical protein